VQRLGIQDVQIAEETTEQPELGGREVDLPPIERVSDRSEAAAISTTNVDPGLQRWELAGQGASANGAAHREAEGYS
jgi:hypothetical protein